VEPGCKWDVWCRKRDETETSESRNWGETETLECRDRDETENETLEWRYRDDTETFKKRLDTVLRPRRSRPRLQPCAEHVIWETARLKRDHSAELNSPSSIRSHRATLSHLMCHHLQEICNNKTLQHATFVVSTASHKNAVSLMTEAIVAGRMNEPLVKCTLNHDASWLLTGF